MRGKQATKLRRLSRILHATLVANGEIPSPETRVELSWQRHKLYQTLKQRWKQSSRPKCLDSEIRSSLSKAGLPSWDDRGSNSSENSPKPRVL